ncbi:MAG: Thiosulfate sulfurtransferase [Candidatus Heimdallarchaeota archaeon LC_3]|nr:MAG: Thiosulfate sulfurtransferase [Candidatus Heimdallarchaeota archaeon LC_3]
MKFPLTEKKIKNYEIFDVLVTTDWIASNIDNQDIRIVESNEDTLLYPSGHILNAVEVDWIRDLNHPIKRDYLDREEFNDLASRIGLTKDTTVVFYGDKSNWWACYAFWVFNLFGHTKTKIMDGGRLKWEKEGREFTRDTPKIVSTDYNAPERDDTKIRSFRDEVLEHINEKLPLIDVRSVDEFTGKRLHMEGYPNEGALRGGHIPAAKNVPWARAVNENGSFKSRDQLEAIYLDEVNLSPKNDVIVYCRIGERSAHTWFVLTYLLGFKNVRNYDGSWTEWGNLVGVPIEK